MGVDVGVVVPGDALMMHMILLESEEERYEDGIACALLTEGFCGRVQSRQVVQGRITMEMTN